MAILPLSVLKTWASDMPKSIKVLQGEMKNLTDCQVDGWISANASDDRKGVQKLIETLKKNKEKALAESKRIEAMTLYERQVKDMGYRLVAGIDEVGRGPLAGPVVACAVVLKEWLIYPGINDSKKVSLKNRHLLFEAIDDTAVAVGYGLATPEEIETHNILQATKMAMVRAIDALDVKPDYLLIDAVKLDLDLPQMNIVKGDEKSVTIAAASIMAKVTRDQMMAAYDQEYPGYDFSNNKGYGTQSHYKGLDEKGISPIHRKTFVKEYL